MATRQLLQRLGRPGLQLVVSGFQFLALPGIVLRWQRHNWITWTTQTSNMLWQLRLKILPPQKKVCNTELMWLDGVETMPGSTSRASSASPLFHHFSPSWIPLGRVRPSKNSIGSSIYFTSSLDIQTATSWASVFIEPPKKTCPEFSPF